MAVHPVSGARIAGAAPAPRPRMIGYYSQFPHEVARDTELSPGARLLYAIVQGWMMPDGWCYRTEAQLADDYGSTPRQIQRLLDALLERGYLFAAHAGRGQRKVYAPVVGLDEARLDEVRRAQHDKYVAFSAPNTTDSSGWPAPNTTFLTPQHDIFVAPNTTFLSSLKEDIPVYPEEEPGVADAAPAGARPDEISSQLDVPEPVEISDEPSPVEIPESPPEARARKPRPTAAQRAAADPGVARVWERYRERVQPNAIVCADTLILARLRRFSPEQLERAMDNFAADWWWSQHCASKGTSWFFKSDARIEEFLNLKPRAESSRQNTYRPGNGRAETSSHLAGITDPEMLADIERNRGRW
jgi:hypothetical protein